MVDTSTAPCRPNLSLDEAPDSISPIEAAAASPAVFKFVLSFLDDTGAGRFITSKKELERQGVPKYVLDAVVKEATEPVNFNTGGGLKGAS